MFRLRFSGRTLQLTTAVACCAVSLALMGASRGAITKLTLNPDAPVVDMFDGMEQGQFEVRLVAQSPHEGRIFITNKTDKPLTVAVPKGLVGVHVLPQIGLNPGNNLIGNQPGGLNNGLNGQNGQNGLAQSVGGNAAPVGNNAFPGGGPGFPGNNGQNNNFPNGLGFFSIPPEKTVQIALNSVCLNYGRREPNAALRYQLVRAETVTTDPVLLQLLEEYSPRTNRDVQQAAAWHLTNGLTWEQISQLTDQKVPGNPTPLFTSRQIQGARELVEQVKKHAADRPKKADTVRSVVTK